jgi:DNA-directed RNA polymerase subunit RPC12/RpoP
MGRLFDLLFGCRHRRLSRPVTPTKQSGDARQTYVVCLDCGKRLAYDLTAMRVGKTMRD